MYLLIPVMLAVAAALAWSWWSGRIGRDPASSVDSFHRALDAMQPRLNPEGRSAEKDDESPTPVP